MVPKLSCGIISSALASYGALFTPRGRGREGAAVGCTLVHNEFPCLNPSWFDGTTDDDGCR